MGRRMTGRLAQLRAAVCVNQVSEWPHMVVVCAQFKLFSHREKGANKGKDRAIVHRPVTRREIHSLPPRLHV